MAIYENRRGRPVSAGTYATVEAAQAAWEQAEKAVAEGESSDPRKGRQKFKKYPSKIRNRSERAA